jgi:hypothetical protein
LLPRQCQSGRRVKDSIEVLRTSIAEDRAGALRARAQAWLFKVADFDQGVAR